jgi:hypothetical protein
LASGTYKVIDPAGAKVYRYWEDSITASSSSKVSAGSVEVAHLPQGTSVEVTATKGKQARIVSPNVGCVFLASLEQIASAPVASEASAPAPTHRYETRRSVALSPAAAPTSAPAPAAPPPEDDDAVMAEETETQDQANARRRDEITANLDQLAINRPDTYTTLVGSLVRLTRDLLGMENPTTSVWL